MEGYIQELLLKYGHPMPTKPVCTPHKCKPINYGASSQLVDDKDTSSPLDEAGVRRVQGIVGAVL